MLLPVSLRRLSSLPFNFHRTLAMATPDWKPIPQRDSIPPYSVFTKSIVKSHLDQRQYRVIRLENDLTAILIHDPYTEHAAVSLDVAVGHLSDPVSSTLSPTFGPFHSLHACL